MKEKINFKKTLELAVVFILTVAFTLIVSTLLSNFGQNLPSNLTLILSEGSILIPSVIYLFVKKLNLKEDFGINKIKIPTILLSFLLGFLVIPIASFVNVLSQFFVPNTLVQATDSLMEGSTVFMVLIVGIAAPCVEEFVFRGLLHRGLSKSLSPILGIVLSALLFGIIHLNLNQLCYAFVLGMIFAWVNHNSNSIISSTIMHAVVNTTNILMLVLVSMAYSLLGENLTDSSEQLRTNPQSLTSIAIVYFIMAAIAFAIMIPCVKAIKKIENRDSDSTDQN